MNDRRIAWRIGILFAAFALGGAAPESEPAEDDDESMPVDEVPETAPLAPREPAPPDPGPLVAILINPIQPALGLLFDVLVIPIEVQVRLSPLVSLDVTPALAYYLGGVRAVGASVSFGARVTPFGRGLRGLYLVPRFEMAYVRASSGTQTVSALGYAVTAEVGYAWVWGNFIINLGAGGGYRGVISDVIAYTGLQHFQLIINPSLGVAF